jgi:recombination protein RecA
VNLAIGGLGYGRFCTLYGNRAGGKTMFALQTVAKAQAKGDVVAWLDVEKQFSPEWAQNLGVNPDQMLLSNNIITIAGMAEQAVQLILDGVDVLVVDSISQLLPTSYFEDAKVKDDKLEMSSLANSGQIGTFSKNLGTALNMMNSVNTKTCIILISQVRNQIGSYGASIGYMGGKALEHANSTVLKFWRAPGDTIEKDIHLGDIILKRPVGATVTWTAEKNRGPGMGWSNKYDIYTGGPHVGIDLYSEIVTFGTEYGVIKKGGAWYDYDGLKAQGAENMAQALRDNPEASEVIYQEILKKGSA